MTSAALVTCRCLGDLCCLGHHEVHGEASSTGKDLTVQATESAFNRDTGSRVPRGWQGEHSRTYRNQSTAMMSVMSSVGSPTDVSTITMVTRPAWGMPAAPMLAAVAVMLQGTAKQSHQPGQGRGGGVC